MVSFRTVQPKITRIVQVHAIVEKIAGVNGPLVIIVDKGGTAPTACDNRNALLFQISSGGGGCDSSFYL